MFIQRVADAIQPAAYLGQEGVKAVLLDAFYGAIFDAALEAADLERHLAEILYRAVVLEPIEIPLDIVYRIDHRPREIVVQHYLFQDVGRLETFAVSFEVQLVPAQRQQQVLPVAGIGKQVGIIAYRAELGVQNINRLYGPLQVLADIHKRAGLATFHRDLDGAVVEHYLFDQHIQYPDGVVAQQGFFEPGIFYGVVIFVQALPKVLGDMFLYAAGIFTRKRNNINDRVGIFLADHHV